MVYKVKIFTVCFFGHREMHNVNKIEARLKPVLKQILKENEFVDFLVGRNGAFDIFVASLIKSVQRETGLRNSELTLVLPYPVAQLNDYENYYDHVLIPEYVGKVHPKRAYTVKNRWMVDRSDLIIVNVEHRSGGAYAAFCYANTVMKPIINLAKP